MFVTFFAVTALQLLVLLVPANAEEQQWNVLPPGFLTLSLEEMKSSALELERKELMAKIGAEMATFQRIFASSIIEITEWEEEHGLRTLEEADNANVTSAGAVSFVNILFNEVKRRLEEGKMPLNQLRNLHNKVVSMTEAIEEVTLEDRKARAAATVKQ